LVSVFALNKSLGEGSYITSVASIGRSACIYALSAGKLREKKKDETTGKIYPGEEVRNKELTSQFALGLPICEQSLVQAMYNCGGSKHRVF